MSWRNLIWIVMIGVLAGLALVLAHRRTITIHSHDPAVDDLAGAIKVYKFLKRKSYFTFTPGQACRGAIEGMVRRIDEYSEYIPPGDALPFKTDGAGRCFETGLRVARQAGKLMVIGSLPDSPASRAGLLVPMEVVSINGIKSVYLTEKQARRMLQRPCKGKPACLTGEVGRDVIVSLRRDDGTIIVRRLEPTELKVQSVIGIVRAAYPRLPLPTYLSDLPAGKAGAGRGDSNRWRYLLDETARIYYIRIREFLDTTPGELQEVYRHFDDPRGIILDLRDNPGGTLSSAVAVADRFIKTGLIVRTAESTGQQHAYYAHEDGTYPRIPMIVLINDRTASAAEIVAGALKVHKRALIVGQESYGKWFVQKTFELGYGLGKVYLTTAEYFLTAPVGESSASPDRGPSRKGSMSKSSAITSTKSAPAEPSRPPAGRRGGNVRRHGVRPDVPLRLTVLEKERLKLLRIRAMVAVVPSKESDGKPHLPGRSRRSSTRHFRSYALMREILDTDSQLALALNILKNTLVCFPTGQGPSVEEMMKEGLFILNNR